MFEQAVIFAPDWDSVDPSFVRQLPSRYAASAAGRWTYPISLLANALVFYDQVRLVGTDEDFGELMRCVGPGPLLDLCTGGKLTFTRIDGAGFYSEDQHDRERLRLHRFSPTQGRQRHLAGGGRRSLGEDQFHVFALVMRRHLHRAENPQALIGPLLSAMWSVMEQFDEETVLTGPQACDRIAVSLLANETASRRIIQDWFELAAPGCAVPADTHIVFDYCNDRGFTGVGLDFDPREAIAGGYSDIEFCKAILNHTMSLVRNIVATANCGGDIASPGNSGGLIERFASDRARRSTFHREIPDFLEMNFADSDAVGRAIAEGRRSFGDLLNLIEKKETFGRWLRGVPASSELAIEYTRYLKGKSWVESERGKALRFMLFTGAGVLADHATQSVLGTAGGVALGAFDTFLLERILGGWKPSRFVDHHLGGFVARP